MTARTTRIAGQAALSALILLMLPSASEASTPLAVLVADATGGRVGKELRVERQPRWTDGTGADLDGPGIRLRSDGAGVTVFVDSFAITGGTPSAADNDFTRINSVMQVLPALGDGTTIQLAGTFDWTEPNALAAWQAADYAVIPPPGVADVTVRAAALGDAAIEGPGELADPAISYEGFLQLFGGTYQGWTIENLVVRGFDWPIGMYFAAGGSAADFDGVTVRGNRIEMVVDTPGSSGTGTGEAPQNIGLHYAFGHDQTIQGNEIIIPGTGINTGTEVSASVAMQCATGGGSTYDGLLITGNTIRVTGAPVAGAERLFGIWENGHSHQSNIEISGNLFVNEDPANDPATNLQRAFWVTSHSSATTTVLYADNLAAGANIAIHWIGDAYQSAPPATVQPVLVISNALLDNGTGVWVHTDDLAPDPGGTPTNMSKAFLRFNRIVGNAAGVRSDDAEVTAEDNWWGCNGGAGAAGCDTAVTSGTAGFLDGEPHLVLSLDVTPVVVPSGGVAAATADLHLNSDGIDTSAEGWIPNGTPVEFAASGGVMSPDTSATTAGAAVSSYTAGAAPGEFSVLATVDSETVETDVLVTVEAALTMTMTPPLQTIDDGEIAALEITIGNAGPGDAMVTTATVDFPAELTGVAWVCAATGGGSCTAAGAGDIDDSPTLPVGSSVTYTATGTAPDPFVGLLTVAGSLTLPPFIVDPDPADNAASAVIRSVTIFEDGFESGDTTGWSAAVP